jgi:hypothetical protein
MLTHVNTVEQNAAIDGIVFEKKSLDLQDVSNVVLVSQADIDIRTKALTELETYIDNLSTLASGKAISDIGTQTSNLSKALGDMSKTAASLPKSKANFISNGNLGTSLDTLSTVFGALARIIEEHKARAALEKSIADTQKPIDDFIGLIKIELNGAYARQKATLGLQASPTILSELL